MKKIILLFLFLFCASSYSQFTNKRTLNIDKILSTADLELVLSGELNLSYMAGDKALISSGTGGVVESSTTATELGYVSGVTSSIQDQIDNFNPSPLTTKGDIYTYDTGDQRLGIGTPGQVLVVNLSTATGLEWIDPPTTSPTTTEGDLIVRGSSEDERLPIGDAGTFLKSNGTTASWETVTASASFITVTKSSSVTLATTGEDNVICDSVGSSRTLTLPAASGNNGLTYKITMLADDNDCTIDANASETIDGELTLVLDYLIESVIIASDGTNWHVLARVEATECETKILTSSVTSNGNVSDFAFSGMTVDTYYMLYGQIQFNITGDTGVGLDYFNGGTQIGRSILNSDGPNNSSAIHSVSYFFQADSTTITSTVISIVATASMSGDSTRDKSFLTLCELPVSHVETTKF